MGFVGSGKSISLAAFALAVTLVLTIAALYLYNIFRWSVDYPDFGISVRIVTGSHVVSSVSENARKAGLEVGDYLLSINGNEIHTFEELRSLANREMGSDNTYLIARDGKTHQITIPNVPYGYKKVFVRSGLPFFLGVCYFLIGVVVFSMKPHHMTTWAYFALCSAFGVYLMFWHVSGVTKPGWLEIGAVLSETFVPAFLTHLGFCFPEKRPVVERYPGLLAVPYIVSAVLFVSVMSAARHIADIPPFLDTLIVVYLALSVLWFLGSCVQLWRVSPSQIVKIRSKMILMGFAISFFAPVADYLVAVFSHKFISTSPNQYLPLFIFFPLSVGYSIVRYDLFDFDTIIKRTYGYILTTGSIAGAYGLFVLISNLVFGGLGFARSPVFPLIFILAVVFLFNPLRNRVQKIIDRVFYRLEYDYRETVQRISESMRSLLKLDEIAAYIMDTALGIMFIDSGCVVLLDQEKQHCECILASGKREKRQNEKLLDECENPAVPLDMEMPLDDPIIKNLAERKKELTIYEIQEDPAFVNERDVCIRTFERLDATLIVPMIYEERLTGFISLGEKRSGTSYRREDINLLNTLANQGVVAIENALLLEEMIEKERMEEELAIARDLQSSMLPAVVPEIKGAEISAVSVSAREVGGDFYDFIEMGKGSLGVVIGDVTGKSVSGALVMSASRSIFRMLSEEKLGVGEMMNRANRRTKQDITKGMFVALLYAVLTSDGRTLRFCSAGQTQPILISSETGNVRLLETEGDTFPLGILEEAEYQETRLELSPGDKIVFYTDGIVEAMNEQGKMFGFDRFLEVVNDTEDLSANALLQKITDSVDEFAAGAAQHDDLTVIVIRVTE